VAGKSKKFSDKSPTVQARLILHVGFMTGAKGRRVDELERRSRLVSMAYPVLAAMALPMDGAADGEVYSALASAFHRKAAEAAELSQGARRADKNLAPARASAAQYIGHRGEHQKLTAPVTMFDASAPVRRVLKAQRGASG
jgi:hypothetical protein